ncbi:ZAR1-like protein [Lamellibrachia satsuma]|nr:ZAR1-like protein [Lamellibrachia satsuma]
MYLKRKYGYFHCKECGNRWGSSYVFCHGNTRKVAYRQDCSNCDESWFPYRHEPLRRSECEKTNCSCDRTNRHINVKKPHRSDLCHKCMAGDHCQQNN